MTPQPRKPLAWRMLGKCTRLGYTYPCVFEQGRANTVFTFTSQIVMAVLGVDSDAIGGQYGIRGDRLQNESLYSQPHKPCQIDRFRALQRRNPLCQTPSQMSSQLSVTSLSSLPPIESLCRIRAIARNPGLGRAG